MLTIDKIHRENLKLLAQELGGVAAAAAMIGCSSSQYSQWLNGSENSGTGKPRGMRPSSARKIEEKTGKPIGWLDVPHSENPFEDFRLSLEHATEVPEDSDSHSEDAMRLRALFDAREPKISQAEFGEEYRLGTQGMVWQYLSGTRPLNIDAAVKFARGLGTTIEQFSPTIASQITEAYRLCGSESASPPSVASLTAETAHEMRLLLIYRFTDGDGRRYIDTLVSTVARRIDAARERKHAA